MQRRLSPVFHHPTNARCTYASVIAGQAMPVVQHNHTRGTTRPWRWRSNGVCKRPFYLPASSSSSRDTHRQRPWDMLGVSVESSLLPRYRKAKEDIFGQRIFRETTLDLQVASTTTSLPIDLALAICPQLAALRILETNLQHMKACR